MCQLCTISSPINPDAFADKLLATLNGSGVALMLSIGHRTGLFDALEDGKHHTSHELADLTGLNERYIREWLGALTVAQIIAHDPVEMSYWLPKEHAAFLTRAASPNNFASFFQYISVLGAVEDDIVDCFKQGGGVPYSRFTRFHEVMADESLQSVVAGLDDHILKLDATLVAKLEEGMDVLDLGCGRGLALVHMARRFPYSRFTGIDFSQEAIEYATRNAQLQGLPNVKFEVQDAATFDRPQSYDFITTFDAIHDQVRPDLVLANIRKALRPTGLYLMADISGSSAHAGNMDHPLGPFIYTISLMHCMTVSLSAGGMGLGAAWGRETALRMLAEAGFTNVRVENLPHDIQNSYYLCRY